MSFSFDLIYFHFLVEWFGSDTKRLSASSGGSLRLAVIQSVTCQRSHVCHFTIFSAQLLFG